MDRLALTDIANRARVLATTYPSAARDLLRELKGAAITHGEPALAHYTATDRHAIREIRKLCAECADLLNQLALLCRKHLPALRLQWVRLLPSWRADDAALDWQPIVAELRLIEDEAITARETADAAPPEQAVTLDAATEARDKWIYEQCMKGTAYETIIRKPAKVKGKVDFPETVNGVKDAAKRYAKRHNLPPIPRRKSGRPSGKNNMK